MAVYTTSTLLCFYCNIGQQQQQQQQQHKYYSNGGFNNNMLFVEGAFLSSSSSLSRRPAASSAAAFLVPSSSRKRFFGTTKRVVVDDYDDFNINISRRSTASTINTKAWLHTTQALPLLSSSSSPFRLYSSSSSSQEQQTTIVSTTTNTNTMKNDAIQIVNKAIEAVNPYNAIQNHFHVLIKDDNNDKNNNDDDSSSVILKIGGGKENDHNHYYNLSEYDEIVLVAFGKASSAMATAVLQQLQQHEEQHEHEQQQHEQQQQQKLVIPKSSGIVICKDDHATKDEIEFLSKHNIQIQYASHPVPDQRSVDSANKILNLVEMKSSSPQKSLIVCCISGGGSSLFCSPQSPLTLNDLQVTNNILLKSGMSIKEMNIIRKKIETGKGGRLAMKCNVNNKSTTTLISLVLSDVLGDPLDLIASGPTVPDLSNHKDAWEIIQRYQIKSELPKSVIDLILSKKFQEEEEEENAIVENNNHNFDHYCQTILVGNNDIAVTAAAEEAFKLGYNPIILGTQIEGEAKEIANFYIGMALYIQQQQQSLASSYAISRKNNNSQQQQLPVALIAGGETTVTLPSDNTGKGGRNQELALSAAIKLDELQLHNVILTSIGTDGTDGPTDAAGAIVDSTTVSNSLSKARDALTNHNAYVYFDELSSSNEQQQNQQQPCLVKTGPTGTNVADVCVTLVGRAPPPS